MVPKVPTLVPWFRVPRWELGNLVRRWELGTGSGQKKVGVGLFDSSNNSGKTKAVHARKTTGGEEVCGGGPKRHRDAVIDTAQH